MGGRVISPGFIDGHCHSDLMVLEDPESEIKLAQGVTTEVVGNCGMTPSPFSTENLDPLQTYVEPVLGTTEREWTWETVGDYVSCAGRRPSENVATYVGHGTLRIAAMGFEDRPASGAELDRMKAARRGPAGRGGRALLGPDVHAGQLHVAGGARRIVLDASRVRRAARDPHPRRGTEPLALHRGGRLDRGEGGCALQISHLKAAGRGNWGSVGRAMELVEDARSRGVDVACDVYPYTAGSTSMMTLLPPWALEGGVSRALERLGDPEARARIRDEVGREGEGWDNLLASTGWESVYVSSLGKGRDESLEGKHLGLISEERGVDPAECMMDLLVEQDGGVSMVFFLMAEDDVDGVVGWEHSLVASDSLHFQSDRPHPRSYGTFPRVLGKFVRERGLLTLEEAVRKMTSFPARRFRLGKRGIVAPGHAADLVVFDPETVADKATYEDPKRLPVGIDLVLVGGQKTVEVGAHLGARNGRFLERSGG